MLEKRFNIFDVENYKKVVGRMRELIESNQEGKIKEEFGNSTNDVWDISGNFLKIGHELDSLDIIHITSDYTNTDAYLYLVGDVENNSATLFYLIRNDTCDVFTIGEYTSVEDLVSQLNKEYEALSFFDNLFNKVEEMLISEEDNEDFYDVMYSYKENINTEYYFNNIDVFLEAYLNPKSHNRKIQYITQMVDDLVKVIK